MMKVLELKANPTGVLFGLLVLIAVATMVPHVFAITYTEADNPYGPMAPIGWAAGLGVAGVMSGIGAWIAVRRSKLH